MTTSRRAFTALRCHLQIGADRIGWMNEFSANESFSNIAIREFGDARVQEHETVTYDVSGSFGFMHILEEPLTKYPDIWHTPNWGNRDEANKALILFEAVPITLVDWVSEKPVLNILKMKPEGRSFRLSEGGLSMWSCSFVAQALVEHSDGPIFTEGQTALSGRGA